MVEVFYHRIDDAVFDDEIEDYLNGIPEIFRHKIINYHRAEDRYRSLFSLKLLQKAAEHYGFSNEILEKVKFNAFGKPYIDSGIEFNLSHSGNYIACIISNDYNVGIDVEKIRPIQLADFENTMTSQQLQSIENASEPELEFFRYWTIKEAAIKADGHGLDIPLSSIETDLNIVSIASKRWYIRELKLDTGYSAHFVTDQPVQNIVITRIETFEEAQKY